jgi:hypothetical protein
MNASLIIVNAVMALVVIAALGVGTVVALRLTIAPPGGRADWRGPHRYLRARRG